MHPAPVLLTLGLDRPGPPRCSEAVGFAEPSGFMLAIATTSFVPQNWQAQRLQSWQPWSYRRLVAYTFLGLSEGAYGVYRDSVPECSFLWGMRSTLKTYLKRGRPFIMRVY